MRTVAVRRGALGFSSTTPASANDGARISNLLAIFLLSLAAMFNPSLLAAVTVMLLMPKPKRLMAGYLLGAYLTSITLGLLIVFSLHGSSTESSSKHTVSP
ncbi:MAG: hypothetical protein JOZ95_03770, partial [Solirubrobacterales bacterium]|nr:hypothetical protein [Solirubrobacterales bacterium]